MLICNHCNTKNLDIAKFCKECGNSDLYDPQAEEKLEQERRKQEELRRLEEEKRKIAQEEREKSLKQRKEFISKHKSKIIISMVSFFLIASLSIYQYFYGGKYSRVYINKLEGKCHYDDASSCKMLQTIYKEKCDDGDGKACFAGIFVSGDLIRVKIDGQWSFLDKNGEFAIEPKFDDAWSFWEGLAKVELNRKWGFIDKSGKFIVKPKFDEAWDFSEGLAKVELNRKYGFMDKNGKIVIEPKFDGVGNFSEGLAAVGLNGKWGFIDKNGEFVIEPKFDDIGY
ncbi:WG repeat-containing protein [Campylobacter coli]|uniref:WG repeat-containing protein n=1 Tax=Campylobacter coli TaxID=195 RepID=UPI002E331C77|nr:WG repeat-containing protein [Campylobacter coli]MED7842166.1 WG repeat-containing protein [Campylobacter coli]MED7844330.1 WG repeat-containing protein [Campylobacter coli]MED7848071.1 WG repeat-containing protein [Campylobacter coli]